MATRLMWLALDLEFAVLRLLPFPFTYNKITQRLDYDLNGKWMSLYWNLYFQVCLPLSAIVGSALLLKEIIQPSVPSLSVIQIGGLGLQILVVIIVFEFAMEFSTNGRGLIDVFNEDIKIFSQIRGKSPRECFKNFSINRSFKVKSLFAILKAVFKDKVDADGIAAFATVGLLLTPILIVGLCLPMKVDFMFHIIKLLIPPDFYQSLQIELFIMRFLTFLHVGVEVARLMSYKILIAHFVIKLRTCNLNELLSIVGNSNSLRNLTVGSKIFSALSVLTLYHDFTFGKQFTMVASAVSSVLIGFGFLLIRLNSLFSGILNTIVLIFYILGHLGMQVVLRNTYTINELSGRFITECELCANQLRYKKYWRRKLLSVHPLSLSLRMGNYKLCIIKRSTRISFIGFIATYTITAILGINQDI